MKKLLEALEAKAIEGQRAIEGGDYRRSQLRDCDFAAIVERFGMDEDSVIEAMVDTKKWRRNLSGFDLIRWYNE